jgi:hypothetical protein
MATANKWRSKLPFIAIGVFILLVIVGLCAAGMDEPSNSWILTGVIIAILCICMWIKPWNWNWEMRKKSSSGTPPATTSKGFDMKAFFTKSWQLAGGAIAILIFAMIVFFVGLFLYEVYNLNWFSKKPVNTTSYSYAAELEWSNDVPCIPLRVGKQTCKAGEWHTYTRTPYTNFYVQVLGGDTSVKLRMYKLGDTTVRLIQSFDISGNGHNVFNKMDASAGKYYITMSDNVIINITGTIE